MEVGPVTDEGWIVREGLKSGDRVVVEGFQKISPGTQVRPVEWKLVLPGGTEFVPPESTLSETALQY